MQKLWAVCHACLAFTWVSGVWTLVFRLVWQVLDLLSLIPGSTASLFKCIMYQWLNGAFSLLMNPLLHSISSVWCGGCKEDTDSLWGKNAPTKTMTSFFVFYSLPPDHWSQARPYTTWHFFWFTGEVWMLEARPTLLKTKDSNVVPVKALEGKPF